MIEQISLFLATPIAKIVLDKFHEGVGSKLGEKVVDLSSDKIKQLGQLIFEKCLTNKPGINEILENAANGSVSDKEKLHEHVSNAIDTDINLKKEAKDIATEIYQFIQLNNSDAKNVQQVFGGQALMVTGKQEQPIVQVLGNPTFNFNPKSNG
jgi:methyl coenzyme M reductase beta subunit